MEKYYLYLGGEQKGPYTLGQLREMWRRGAVNLDTQFRTMTCEEWKTLESMLDLLEPSHPAAPSVSQPHPPAVQPRISPATFNTPPAPVRAAVPGQPSAVPAPIPQQATHIVIHQPVKDHKGLAKAAWILLFLVCGVSILPFFGFASWLFAGPVFLVVFIMSIMILSRGGTLPGILLLMSSIIFGPIFVTCAPVISSFVGLGAAAGAATQKGDRVASQGNRYENRTPIPPAVRAPSPTAKPASPGRGQSDGIPAETVATIKGLLATDISGLDARSISMKLRVNLGTDAGSLHPCGFSQSGELFAYLVLSDFTATLKVREVNSLAIRHSVRLQSIPEIVMWSPDHKSIFMTGSGGFSILQLEEGRQINLPIQGDFGGIQFFWPSPNEIVALDGNRVATLNLDTLAIRRENIDDNRNKQLQQELSPKNAHPRSKLIEKEHPTYEKELLLRNRDGSHDNSILHGHNMHVVTRPDLHVAFLMSGRPRDPEELIALYFGPSMRPGSTAVAPASNSAEAPAGSESPNARQDPRATFMDAYFQAEKNRDWAAVMKKFAPNVEIVTLKNGKTLRDVRMGQAELLKEKKEDAELWPIQRQTIDSEVRIKSANPPYSTASWRMTNRCENPRLRKWNQNQTEITLTIEVLDDTYYIVRVETVILESSKGELQNKSAGQTAPPPVRKPPGFILKFQ